MGCEVDEKILGGDVAKDDVLLQLAQLREGALLYGVVQSRRDLHVDRELRQLIPARGGEEGGG